MLLREQMKHRSSLALKANVVKRKHFHTRPQRFFYTFKRRWGKIVSAKQLIFCWLHYYLFSCFLARGSKLSLCLCNIFVKDAGGETTWRSDRNIWNSWASSRAGEVIAVKRLISQRDSCKQWESSEGSALRAANLNTKNLTNLLFVFCFSIWETAVKHGSS